MLTDTELRKLRPKEKTFKVADRDGMYVTVSTAGTKSFRYDYRLNGRRETLTIGRYDDTAGAKHPRDPAELDFGMTARWPKPVHCSRLPDGVWNAVSHPPEPKSKSAKKQQTP